jgi:hypothetical protein
MQRNYLLVIPAKKRAVYSTAVVARESRSKCCPFVYAKIKVFYTNYYKTFCLSLTSTFYILASGSSPSKSNHLVSLPEVLLLFNPGYQLISGENRDLRKT